MEFQLPTNLQTELIAYDPALKRLARAEKAKTSKKAKYPIGLPPRLMPVEIIRDSLYNDAIEHINSNPAAQRFHEFRLPVGTIPHVEYVTHAVIYHWEGLWVAAWMPPKGKESEYVYGYTHCYKDTATTIKMLPYHIRNSSQFIGQQVGRSHYKINTQLVTKEMIKSGNDTNHWFICSGYGDKGRHMGNAVRHFQDTLAASIPTWSDMSGIFGRLKEDSTLFRLLFGKISTSVEDPYFDKCAELYNMQRDSWEPTADTLFTFAEMSSNYSHYSLYDSWTFIDKAKHILNTPMFRKWIQSQCIEAINTFNDPENRQRRKVIAPLKRIYHLATMIKQIDTVWPGTPLDYYQKHIDVLIGTNKFYSLSSTVCSTWLNTHMPVASFFQIISKSYEEKLEQSILRDKDKAKGNWFSWDDNLGCYNFRCHELDDTFSMIATILSNDKTLEPPKRWRITEFHDHVQAESWKIKNPNHQLPQDLFPTPIKVKHHESNWSFFQPIDTHQLAQWGQAVRNCVGNASSYAEGVRKKNHFIVLGMLDGKPTFTIQLKVSHGVMSVEQIVGFANARLDDVTRTTYTEVFRKALHSREDQLKSES